MKKTFYCVVSKFYDDGHATANITDEIQADEKPASTSRTTVRADIYIDRFENIGDARKAVDETRNA